MALTDEQIRRAALWWMGVVRAPKFDALGGERDRFMELAQVLMSLGAARSRPTETQIAAFGGALADVLRGEPVSIASSSGRAETSVFASSDTLVVDYHPDPMLAHAARRAGLSESVLPIKTSMWFDAAHESVRVRYGYGAPRQEVGPDGALYPLAESAP